MKRSEINAALREMEAMIQECRFPLPPFCHFTPEEWLDKGEEYDEVRKYRLGWDITDYGLDQFDKVGFSIVTLRNGAPTGGVKPYAEKLLYLRAGQSSPMHFHWYKMEDIINRGGGDVWIRVYPSTPEETLGDGPVTVSMDGCKYTVPAGTRLCLSPGQSLTVTPGMYHDFYVPEEGGPVLLGEVSMCNDDDRDNRFLDPVKRFPPIEEDEPPYRLLCFELPDAPAR